MLINTVKALKAKKILQSLADSESDIDAAAFASDSDVDDEPLTADKSSKSKKKAALKPKRTKAQSARKNRKKMISKRYGKLIKKNGGLKDSFAKKSVGCCKIYLTFGECKHAKSGICGPDTALKHNCVCGGKHALADCKESIWLRKS